MFFRCSGNENSADRPDVYLFGSKYTTDDSVTTFPYFDCTGNVITVKSIKGSWSTRPGYATIIFAAKKKKLRFFCTAYSKSGSMSLSSITGCKFTEIPYSSFFENYSDANPMQALLFVSGTLTDITGDITIKMHGDSLALNGCGLYIWEDK